MASPFIFSKLFREASKYSPAKLVSFIYHFPNLLRLYWRLLNDPRVPFYLKMLCYGAIIYFFLPFDLIPDFPLFAIGRVDDFLFLYLAFSKLAKESPPEVIEEHVNAIRGKGNE